MTKPDDFIDFSCFIHSEKPVNHENHFHPIKLSYNIHPEETIPDLFSSILMVSLRPHDCEITY
jgi:hypothetical protein